MTGRRLPPPRVAAAEVAAWLRKYPFAPRYRRAARRTVLAADGVRLRVHAVPGPPTARVCVVLVHGFANSSRSPKVAAFARALAERAWVLVPDLRGHRASGGWCTLGLREPLDVAACVQLAATVAPGLPVVTIGTSLGGIAVLRHAGAIGGVVAAVGISAPAWWGARDRPSSARLGAVLSSVKGRLLLRTLFATRVARHNEPIPDGAPLLAGIAPALTLLVHDPDDHYFGPQHAVQLHTWAREPKALWLLPGIGHGIDVLTPAFAARVLARVEAFLASASPVQGR